ncbi:MAG: DEAD/DEAH box helicase, partial [Thermoanaerobaculia bacterium]|nr:DEAD/DEAH box helicase [Thermoanaerobaculia bacterium]
LLNEKFRLFDGVFGSSDEILGAVESGVDFEKRIAEIYQKCRSVEQIQFEFDQLQRELEAEITEGQKDAREKLLNNFDQEVVEKVRIQSNDYLDRFNQQLWLLTRSLLKDYAHFNEHGYSFTLHTNPFPGETIHPGPYRMGKHVEEVNTYRVGHPLAQRLLEQAKSLPTPPRELTFDYSNSGKRIAILDSLNGKSGWLMCGLYSVSALETEDYLVLSGFTDNGGALDEKQIQRFFDLPCISDDQVTIPAEVESKLVELQTIKQNTLLEELTQRNANWFEVEIDKLDRWAEDRRKSLQVELDELDETIKETRKAARLAPNLPEKLAKQQALRKLETKRDEAWRNYDAASKELEKQKDSLLDEVSKRLEQKSGSQELFVIRWSLR